MKTNLDQYRTWAGTCTHLPVFFQPWWLDAVCPGAWGVCLSKNGEGKIIGILPFFYLKKWFLPFIDMPPLTPYLGPWFDFPNQTKPANRYALEHSVQEMLLKQLPPCVFFRQRWHPALVNALPFRWHGFQLDIKYTYCIQLGDQDLYTGFASALRNNIGNAAKKYRVEQAASGEGFFAMNSYTFTAQKLDVPYSFEQFRRLDEAAQQRNARSLYWAIDLLSQKKEAAIYIVKDQHYAYLLATGRLPDAHNGAVALLIWQALQDLRMEGIQVFDFEGSSLRGVEGFFRQFGGDLKMGLVVKKVLPLLRRFR